MWTTGLGSRRSILVLAFGQFRDMGFFYRTFLVSAVDWLSLRAVRDVLCWFRASQERASCPVSDRRIPCPVTLWQSKNRWPPKS